MRLAQQKEQLRQSSQAELERMLQEERRNLFMARRDSATKQLENPRRIRQVRKNIARILTMLGEHSRGSAEAKR